MGVGSLYNSCYPHEDNQSVLFEWDSNNDFVLFTAIRDIKKDEELLLYYEL